MSFLFRSLFWQIVLSLFIFSTSFAQSKHQLRGKLVINNNPVSGISVYLLRSVDGSLVKLELSGADGGFLFEGIASGKYRVAITDMMVAAYRSADIELDKDLDLGTITLTARTTALKEVSVRSVKPFIQQQYDRTVINVEGSITAAGSTALEILQRAPGVTVDQAENLRLRGRSGVLFMIDGKQVPMTGEDLATYLKGLPANALERIDLITEPSAKYDAAGTAGIINIRLKRSKTAGWNGNVTASYGQGKLPKGNAGFDLSYRNNKLNVFTSYNYTRRSDRLLLTLQRRFLNADGSLQSGFDQDNYTDNFVNAHLGRLAANYSLSCSTVIGITSSFYGSDIRTPGGNYSLAKNSQDQGVSYSTNDFLNYRYRTNPSFNLNLLHKLDTAGRQLTVDLDQSRFNSSEDQDYTTRYFDLQGAEQRRPYLLIGDLDGHLTVRSAKADYVQPLKSWKARLEAGMKSSWVKADNDVVFYDRSNGTNLVDLSKTNRFVYNENINAAYINLSANQQPFKWQVGVRAEHTHNKGVQTKNGSTFRNNYLQLFPSAYGSYQLNKNSELGLTLSRRIDRPSYRQLNPFRYYINDNTYQSGNPYLQPQLTYSAEATYTWQQKYILSYSYARTSNYILSLLIPDLGANKQVQETSRNLARFNYQSISMSIPVEAGQWLSSTNNVLAYYGRYVGNLANTNIRNGRVAFNINSNNQLKLGKGWMGEVTGSFQSAEILGLEDVRSICYGNLGIMKQLWKNKANLKLNVSDVLYTNKTRATDRATGYLEHYVQTRDTRVATLSFTYRFGNTKGLPKPKNGGAEEEKRRAG